MGPVGSRVQVCGALRMLVDGNEVGSGIPVGQARTLVTYLVLNRRRHLDRSGLAQALWSEDIPASADRTIAALLSRARAAVGNEVLPARGDVLIRLPEPAAVDIETAREASHRADAAIAAQQWTTAWTAARIALNVATRGILPGIDLPWVVTERDALHDIRMRAWEAIGEASLGLGGAELVSGRRAGREMIAAEPLRESGYRLAMRVAVAQGNPAEALKVYENLRSRLAEDLGVDPGQESRDLFTSVLASTSA